MSDTELHQALADIKEWYLDESFAPIVDNLAAPASLSAIAQAEARSGHAFPHDLRRLYLLHDGQRDPHVNLFLPYGCGGFAPLAWAAQEVSYALNSQSFPDTNWRENDVLKRGSLVLSKSDLFRDEEWQVRWHCLAAMENFWLMVHLVTGRVFSFNRQDAIYFRADSVTEFLAEFADDLWNELYQIGGDVTLPKVTYNAHAYLKRYPIRTVEEADL